MPPLSDMELEERLSTAGNSLLQPPSSLNELLPVLDQIEELLQKVEQSPARSIQTALSPLMKALVAEELLKHSDVDVKVGVASCISEITRITAPDAPYDDDKMKDVFQLIVSSFENLSDTSSRSYEKRATILETVAKVRSCVIMLDLECDQMINVMFQHFLTAIRGNHADVIFASMETVMTLVLEESEDISPDLLNTILVTLKMNNEAVMPIAKKLAETVIQNSADRLRPYLAQVVKSLDASLDDYGEVLASVCRENNDIVGNSNESISRDELVAEDGREETNSQEKEDPTLIGSSKSIVSNGIKTEEIMTDANFSKKANSYLKVDAKPMPKTESDDCSTQNPVKSEAKVGYSEAQEVADNHEVPVEGVFTSTEDKPVETAESLDKIEGTTTQLSPSHAPENEATYVASPSQSGILCDESPSKKDSLAKREDLVREEIVSVDTASKKASERESISKAENQTGKTRSDEATDEDKALTEEGSSKNDEGSTSDSEARSLHQTEKLGDADSKKPSKEESISKTKKQQHDDDHASNSKARSLHQAEKLVDVASKMVSKGEGISKAKKPLHDEDNTSDSEERSPSQIIKLGDAASKKASKGESTSKAKQLQQKVKKQSDETTDKDKALTEEGASKNDVDNTSDSEARSLKQMRNLVDAASKKTSKGESTSKTKKQQQKGKKRSDETNDKDKALTEEGASKNDGSTSDSEARTLNQTEKLRVAASKKAFKGESIPKVKKHQLQQKQQSEETTNKDKELTEEVASMKGEDNTGDSEAKSLKHTDKLGAAVSKKASKGGSISKAKKQQRKWKKLSDETTNKYKALTENGAAKNDEGSTNDLEARSLDDTKDLGDASNKMEDISFMTQEDGKKSGRLKPTLGKDALKSSAIEVCEKDKVTSPRSPLKSLKDEYIQEETPRMSSKRKRTPGTDKASDSIEYGKNLVGSKVKVWWPKDRMFYEGEIASFDSAKKKHKVVYVDGDEELLNLKRERWQFLGDALVSDGDDDVEHSSHDTSPDVQGKKKGNANAETLKSKRQKMDGSSKSKQKDTATKSGGKSKDDGKQESEMKDSNSKPSSKSVDDDDDTIKPRDHSQKAGGKSQGRGKSKDNSSKTKSQQTKLVHR